MALCELRRRGLIAAFAGDQAQFLTALKSSGGKAAVYTGFDPTAPSLHIGHLVTIMSLRHLKRSGMQPIALVGGVTGMIGDPTGRSSERVALSSTEVDDNARNIRLILERLVGDGITVMDNKDWLSSMSLPDYLRDVTAHFRLSTMLSRGTVQDRMAAEEGCSLMELCYQTVQAYDFWHLHQSQNCVLQVGGSDQWGNIVAGIDLIRRKSSGTAFGLTVPLVTTATGEKLGKSSGNAVWLDSRLSPPYEIFQYFYNLDDTTAEELMPKLVEDPMDQIEQLLDSHRANPGARLAQTALANSVTRMVHGEAALQTAHQATSAFFNSDTLTAEQCGAAAASGAVPSMVAPSSLVLGSTLLKLAVSSGLVSSNAEAKRLIKSGGMYLNNSRITDVSQIVSEGDLLGGSFCVLRSGKKNNFILQVEDNKA